MKVFVTGASGFVGSAVVKELIDNGHTVIGLARSEKSAQAIRQAGAEVLMGSLEDLEVLKHGAQSTDGVIHTAFIHDFSNYDASAAIDKAAIEAIGAALMGTNKPLVVTGGLLGVKNQNGSINEDDAAPAHPRASEAAGLALAGQGVRVSVIRLPPSVHDAGDQGFIPMIIGIAGEKGVSGYIGEGQNVWPAVHRLDAAKLYRLALEKGAAGSRYNAIGDTGIPLREIAEVIGAQLNLPVRSISPDDAAGHFTWMSRFIVMDAKATAERTKQELGWEPEHIGLIEDMKKNYFRS